MKLYSFHYHPGIGDNDPSSCEIVVPGLGKIAIENCISDELKNRIKEECILALKQKMGQVIHTEPSHIVEAIP